MNLLGKSIVKKLKYSFGANFISLLVSVLTVSIIPKFMPIEDYGLYQLFLFYVGYIGVFHFGVLGGGIVRFAGCDYKDLDYGLWKSQSIILLLILVFFTIISYGAGILQHILLNDFMIIMFLSSMFAQHIIWYVISFLQMTNRIEEASKLLFLERISWGIFAVILALTGFYSYKYLVTAYTVTRVLSMVYSLKFVKEIFFARIHFSKCILSEFKTNFRVGFPLTLSDICSMLIIGSIRFCISDVWSVEVFAKTSLILSATFFFLTFAHSASIILLPVLRQINDETSNNLFTPMNNLLTGILLTLLLAYYPAHFFVSNWIPKYADSLVFLGLLFPVVFFDIKFNLLISTYLKKFLMTKVIFYINFFTAILSIFSAYIVCYHIKDLYFAILLITLMIGIRYTLGEIFISKYVFAIKGWVSEYISTLMVIVLFVLISQNYSLWLGMALYILVLIIYLCFKEQILKTSWKEIKMVVAK